MLVKLLVNGFFVLTVLTLITAIHPLLGMMAFISLTMAFLG
jgi:hypothetical protein